MFFDVVSSFRFRVCFVSFVLVVDVEGRFSCFRLSADPFFSFFFPLMLLRGQSTAHCPFFFFFFFFFFLKKKKKNKKKQHIWSLRLFQKRTGRSRAERERQLAPRKRERERANQKKWAHPLGPRSSPPRNRKNTAHLASKEGGDGAKGAFPRFLPVSTDLSRGDGPSLEDQARIEGSCPRAQLAFSKYRK